MAKFEAGQIYGAVGWEDVHDCLYTGVVAEDSDFWLLGRVSLQGVTTDLIDDIETITWAAYDVEGDGTAFTSGSLTVATVMSNTLITGGMWSADSTGYNFTHAIDNSEFTTGGKRYRFEHVFTWSAGSTQSILRPFFEIQVQNVRTS